MDVRAKPGRPDDRRRRVGALVADAGRRDAAEELGAREVAELPLHQVRSHVAAFPQLRYAEVIGRVRRSDDPSN
jgi:hypothetical protein